MKRLQYMTILLALLLLAACAGTKSSNTPVQPVYFYYQRQEFDYGTENGVIEGEVYDLKAQQLDYLQLMMLYIQGPYTEGLLLPIPENVEFLDVNIQSQCATVTMSHTFSELSGYHLSVAAACISRTLLQFDEIQSVRIQVENAFLDGKESLVFTDETLVLQDHGSDMQNLELSVYFASEDNRYLMRTAQTLNKIELDAIPEYLMQYLIDGPGDTSGYPVIPDGTMLLDISIENSYCIVDFSAEFLTNKPETALQERMTVFSIVNTLTELDGVEAVIILVEGQAVAKYVYLDLSQPLYRDETLFGPVRSGVDEFDATLCLPMKDRVGLFVCPICLKEEPTKEKSQLVLEALINYSTHNAYYNLLPEEIEINSYTQSGGVCLIDFSMDPLADCKNTAQMLLCIQSIVLSLNQSGSNRLVQITVNGTALHELYPFSSEYLVPDAAYLNS